MISVCGSIDMPVFLSARLLARSARAKFCMHLFYIAIHDCATTTNTQKADTTLVNERKDHLSKTSNTITP